MRSFILTDLQAGKLPRWALWSLCLLYALPGLIGRDPWRIDDAAGFGVALSMIRGGVPDWLIPNIFGQAVTTDGPLPFWLAALIAHLLPWLSAHSAVRLAWLANELASFVAIWYAVYLLARRPGVQPSNPFGASPSRVDYARAIADSTLLVLLATIGLIARIHETTAQANQVLWASLFLLGCAQALERPGRGGAIAGGATGALFLTSGFAPASAFLVTLLLLPLCSTAYRLVARPFLWIALPLALAISAPWLVALAQVDDVSRGYLRDWLAGNRAQVSGPTVETLTWLARYLPWFFWPAWPMAVWAVVRWRGRLSEPAVILPLLSAATIAATWLLAPALREGMLLPAVPAIAMLAAMGLPTLRRAVVSLIDWFSVMTFTLAGLVAWAYWVAYIIGWPPMMAFKTGRLAPGFRPDFIVDEIVLGLAATLAWLLLVRWRISRQPRMIWRAAVLSSAGLVLAWFLGMTLWLPVFNERNTYRDIGQGIAGQMPADYDCIDARGLGPAERASLGYFGNLKLRAVNGMPWLADESTEHSAVHPSTRCDWLLIEDNGPLSKVIAPDEPGWIHVWEGVRRTNADERFRLYRRGS